MILQALEIDNNGDIELITETALAWTDELLDGRSPIIVSSSLTAGYQDITSIENFDKWSSFALGKFAGFRDWKCIRSQIKALALSITSDDLGTNWSSLNAEEQKLCCKYLTNIVPSARFIETYSNALDRTQIAMTFDSLSTSARAQRYETMRLYLLDAIGGTNAIAFLDDAIRESRVEAYLEGIESKADDGKDGLMDFIDATDGTIYDSNATGIQIGLRLRGYGVVNGSGDSLSDICDGLLAIMKGLI